MRACACSVATACSPEPPPNILRKNPETTLPCVVAAHLAALESARHHEGGAAGEKLVAIQQRCLNAADDRSVYRGGRRWCRGRDFRWFRLDLRFLNIDRAFEECSIFNHD